jgi:hypothetical protein
MDNQYMDRLERQFGHLAMKWRGARSRGENADDFVQEYHAIMDELWTLGWNPNLDPDEELPEEFMTVSIISRCSRRCSLDRHPRLPSRLRRIPRQLDVARARHCPVLCHPARPGRPPSAQRPAPKGEASAASPGLGLAWLELATASGSRAPALRLRSVAAPGCARPPPLLGGAARPLTPPRPPPAAPGCAGPVRCRSRQGPRWARRGRAGRPRSPGRRQ